jgi:hypothetical protein
MNIKVIINSLLFLVFYQNIVFSQCDVKTINRSDGTTVRYLNPELIGSCSNCELGISVSNNGTDYFINTTVRYASISQKQIGTLKLQLQNNDAVTLILFNSQLATMKGENISLGVYLTTKGDIYKLKNNPLKRIVFTEANGVNQIVMIEKNSNVIMKQIKCIEGN